MYTDSYFNTVDFNGDIQTISNCLPLDIDCTTTMLPTSDEDSGDTNKILPTFMKSFSTLSDDIQDEFSV